MYQLIKPILFLFGAERAHYLAMGAFSLISRIPGLAQLFLPSNGGIHPGLEREVFGLKFSGPVGLAAGFDKDARWVSPLSKLGFGFIEIGTLTPVAQKGNPKPRLFRLKKDQALINRMGFNNKGVERAVKRLKKRNPGIIVGGNIGKNKDTDNALAVRDYLIAMKALYPVVDYFVVNVSSPNTPGLRDLQEKGPLLELLFTLKKEIGIMGPFKPILLKIAPDLTEGQLLDIVEIIKETNISGVIATNTTIDRGGLITSSEKVARLGAGGLSGKPLHNRSKEVVAFLFQHLGTAYPIIGVGGIMTPQDAKAMMDAGAALVQVYTGFVYGGPGFPARINQFLAQKQN